MKILHVLQSDRFSGAENVVCQIIKMFESDDRVEMAYTSQDGQIKEALSERRIKFYPMKSLCHTELKRVVNEYCPDIIHGHDIRGAIEASRFGQGRTIIHTIHGNDLRMRKITMKSVLYLFSAMFSKHIFWVSKSCYEQYVFKKLLQSKSSVLYNVIDTGVLYKRRQEDVNVYDYDAVFIGRIAYPKNPQRLIKVISLVVEKLPEFKVAVVGTGNLEDTTQQLAAEYGILKNIDFLGYKKNPYKILDDSKLMIMTSDWEGTPMVALEAVALGKPIVSTPTDGMCDIIENGINGYCEQDEDALAARIVEIITDDEVRAKFSKAQLKISFKINDVNNYKRQLEVVYGID